MEETAPDGQNQKAVQLINKRGASVSAIAACSLAEYRRHVSQLPRPSSKQIEDFVQFVSGAHSWYKHLPLLPPGEPFHFFVDPMSGYDHAILHDGSVAFRERTDSSPRFHYTWMTTREYRRRFAHLTYAEDASPDFFIYSEGSMLEYVDLPVFTIPDGAYRIPPEVAEAGLVELTSVIHPYMAQVDLEIWYIALRHQTRRDEESPSHPWPLETGGEEPLRQIKQACEQGVAKGWCFEKREDLAPLVLPEKRRLQKNMTEAIDRMLALVYNKEQ